MKKILLIVTIFLTSCSNKKGIVITKDNYKTLINNSNPAALVVNDIVYPVRIGSDGHYYYLVYIAVGANLAYDRPLHLGGCPTCKNQSK